MRRTWPIIFLFLLTISLLFLWINRTSKIPIRIPEGTSVNIITDDKGDYKLGEIFPFKVEFSRISTAFNVVQADIAFDPQRLQAHTITTSGSFARFFIQKDIDNKRGHIRIIGGIENPGYQNEGNSLFAKVYFQSISPGKTEISFLDTSLVLANNGRGDNVLLSFPTTSYLISEERIADSEVILTKDLIIREEEEKDPLKTPLFIFE